MDDVKNQIRQIGKKKSKEIRKCCSVNSAVHTHISIPDHECTSQSTEAEAIILKKKRNRKDVMSTVTFPSKQKNDSQFTDVSLSFSN